MKIGQQKTRKERRKAQTKINGLRQQRMKNQSGKERKKITKKQRRII